MNMRPRKKEYKIFVRFSQEIPIIVMAFNAVRAKELALQKAKELATDSEQLEVITWRLVEDDK